MLEKEVIASFDKAVQQKDLGTMAECAQVMTEFERGDTALMQVKQTPSFIESYLTLQVALVAKPPTGFCIQSTDLQ